MAYAVTLPPVRVGGGLGAGGSLWLYKSADVHTDVDAVGYFTNGYALGMRLGDVVFVVETDNSYVQTTHSVITATVDGAVTISAAT